MLIRTFLILLLIALVTVVVLALQAQRRWSAASSDMLTRLRSAGTSPGTSACPQRLWWGGPLRWYLSTIGAAGPWRLNTSAHRIRP